MRAIELYGTLDLPNNKDELLEIIDRIPPSHVTNMLRLYQNNHDLLVDTYHQLQKISHNFKIPITGININDMAEKMDVIEQVIAESLRELTPMKDINPTRWWYMRVVRMQKYMEEFNRY